MAKRVREKEVIGVYLSRHSLNVSSFLRSSPTGGNGRPPRQSHQPAKTRIDLFVFFFFFSSLYRSRLFSHQFSLRGSGPAREVTMCALCAFLLFVIYSTSLDRKEVCVKVESDWRKNEPIRENGIVRPHQLSKWSTDAKRDLLIRWTNKYLDSCGHQPVAPQPWVFTRQIVSCINLERLI